MVLATGPGLAGDVAAEVRKKGKRFPEGASSNMVWGTTGHGQSGPPVPLCWLNETLGAMFTSGAPLN